jgi:hypothetical protein
MLRKAMFPLKRSFQKTLFLNDNVPQVFYHKENATKNVIRKSYFAKNLNSPKVTE